MRAIVEDTRQQAGKHGRKHADFERMGQAVVRSKLPAGDYAFAPRAAVDTKRDIYELAACLTTGHARFARECDAVPGSILVILTENDQGIRSLADLEAWVESDADLEERMRASGGAVKKRLVGATLAKACRTMHEHHGTYFGFCRPDESAEMIVKLLEWGEGDAGDGETG